MRPGGALRAGQTLRPKRSSVAACFRDRLAQPSRTVDLAEAETQHALAFQSIVPVAGIDVDRLHRHPMFARIVDELGGGIEPIGWALSSAQVNTAG